MRAFNGRQEAVSAPRHGLQVSGAGGGISQRFPQLIYCGVQAVIEVNECVGRPQLLTQLFARNDFSRMLQQVSEHLKRLLLQADSDTALAQLSARKIHRKESRAYESSPRPSLLQRHGNASVVSH